MGDGMRKGWLLLAGALAAAVLTSGCGSDSGDAAPSAKVIPQPVFKKEAERICKKTYEGIRGEYGKFVEGKEDIFVTQDEVDEYVEDVILPHRQQELEEWKALGAPKGEGEKVESMIEAYEEGIEITEENHARAVTGALGPFAKVNGLAREYNLNKCKYG